jgi:hypothetical protein
MGYAPRRPTRKSSVSKFTLDGSTRSSHVAESDTGVLGGGMDSPGVELGDTGASELVAEVPCVPRAASRS